MRGYAGKILEVNLSDENIKDVRLSDEVLRNYFGGRGLAAKILWDRLGERWEEIDPFGPENLLLLLTGPLTGFALGARICISGKSPQSNGIVGSTLGGEFPIDLKCSGYDGVIFTGKADKPVYVFIKDSEVEIKDASHVWGKDSIETVKILVKEGREDLQRRYPRYGLWREPSMIYIGPAGERMSRIACVATKWTHGAGYGGYGGVMGSKNLKAVLVKGTSPLPKVADLDKVLELADKVSKINLKSTPFRRWGTGYGGYEVGARLSSEPVKNWREEWHDERSFGVDEFEKYWVKKYWGDFGCPITCLKISIIKSNELKSEITDNPDYENQAYLGPNLGIFRPEEAIYLTALTDRFGLCGIQTGNVLGFACDLYNRGILTKKDLDGIELNWGDVDAFASLIKMINERKGIGDILAEGTYRAALRIGKVKGVDVRPYAITSKGIGIGAHGVRSGKDYPAIESYSCSVQGGDHTSVAHLPLEHLNSELRTILWDSGVICWFNFGSNELCEYLWGFIEAVTGWKITSHEWFNTISRRILHIQRAALLLGGPDLRWLPKIDDSLPDRWYQPLTEGPCKGAVLTSQMLEESRKEYYEAVGWDECGIPKSEELERLSLHDVDKKLRDLRMQDQK